MTQADSSSPASAGSIFFNTRPPLALLMVLAMMSPLALLIVIPALPTLATEFDVGLGQIQWLVTVYLLGVGSMQLVIGPLVDRIGRRRILLIGIPIFLVASLLATVTTSLAVLIVVRVLQAMSDAAMSVVSRAAVQDVFRGREVGKAMSFITLSLQIPGIVGPIIGGVLVMHFGWTSLFFVLAGLGLILLVAVILTFPETRPPERTEAASYGRVASDYIRLVTNSQFSIYTLVISLCSAAIITMLTVFPSALTDLFDKSAAQVGYYTAISTIAGIAGSLIAARLVGKFGMRRLLVSALTAVSVYLGFYLLSIHVLSVGLPGLLVTVAAIALAQSIAISMGFAEALGADAELRGTASGLAGAVASIVSAAFAIAGGMIYAYGLSFSLLVVLGCFFSSLVLVVIFSRRNASFAIEP